VRGDCAANKEEKIAGITIANDEREDERGIEYSGRDRHNLTLGVRFCQPAGAVRQ
jgi:hypothetical protein